MKPYLTFIDASIQEGKYCGQCAKLWKPECTYLNDFKNRILFPTDRACQDFELKLSRVGRRGSAEKREWKLDLHREIPETKKPCGFYGDTLTESVWLPYQDQKEGIVQVRPSVITIQKEKPIQILDFIEQNVIKGTFPSQELQTLMSVKGVRRFMEDLEKPDLRDIDQQIDTALRKHLALDNTERILAKRWIEGTYFYDCFDSYPIESILGVSESGKSRLCLVNLALSYHAEGLIDPTEASIFRSKEEDRVTLIVDESEYLNNPILNATIRILINASYSKNSGFVTRYDEADGKRVKQRFDLYSPMCLSGIAGLEGITLSRAFRLVMKRVDRDYPKADLKAYTDLRDSLYILRLRHVFDVSDLYAKTNISDVVTARFEELFKPLFTMTAFMGTQEEYELLKKWCREYQENFRIEALNIAEEEMILTAIANIQSIDDWYSLKDLSTQLAVMYSGNLTPKRISNILYRLGLTKRRKIHGCTLIYAPQDLLEQCASRIGLRLSELLTLPNHLNQPETQKEKTLDES